MRNLMKKIFIICNIVLFTLVGCKTIQNQDEFSWRIDVLESKSNSNLSEIQETTQYDGTKTSQNISNLAQPNNLFVLVNLKLEKQIDGGISFDWNNLFLKDQNNHQYFRLDDSFLELYNFERLPNTTLQIGTQEGWVAFEVPSKNVKNLVLVHETNEGVNSQSLNIK